MRLKAKQIKYILVLFLISICLSESLYAQEAISVQIKTSAGEHYEALKLFETLPKRKITAESIISAARSAWALSLHDRAQGLFDQALETGYLSDIDKARTYLSKAIIHHQQEHHQMALLTADKALEMLPNAGPLRAKVWLLIGQAKLKLKEYPQAYENLKKALDESAIEDEGEARFQLGKAAMQLANYQEAEENFKAVPYGHERTAQAIRELAESYVQRGMPEKSKFWIEKGKAEFPDQFIDSWPAYALMQAAIKAGDLATMRTIRNDVNRSFPAADFWVTIINATVEMTEKSARSAALQASSEQEAT